MKLSANKTFKWICATLVSVLTVLWVASFVGVVSHITFPFGWWAIVVLAVLGLLVLNILYFILALPSLLIFLIKNRSKSINQTISTIYMIGMFIAITIPWYMINSDINISKTIIAIIINILVIIFYIRKIKELHEEE